MNSQSGQALPLAMLALAIGALVVSPFLGHAGSSLIGSRVYGEAIAGQSACDAGVEHAIWSLTRGSLAEEFANPGDTVTYQLDETINGLAASVTVTANVTGIMAGDISDSVIDTLEFDTADGWEPSVINVSGDIYAVAYRGSSNDGFLKTIAIATDGAIGNSAIDTLEFDPADGYEPCVIHVSGNTYAIAYRGSSNRGYLKTVSIAADGVIGNSTIDSLTFDASLGYKPRIIRVSGTIYAIAYRGPGSDGFLKTVSIAADGAIGNSSIDTLEFDTSDGFEPSIIYISGNVFAIAYRGPGSDGFLKTVSIAADGQIADSVIDTLEFDTSNGYEPNIINIVDEIYAIAFRGSGNNGLIKTVSITASGFIDNSVIDSLSFDSPGYEPRIIMISNDACAVAYRGPGDDGFLKTITIAADGNIADSVTDSLRYDTSTGYEPAIINTSGNIYAIAYRGPGNDGFVKTLSIARAGASAAYEIVATAGGRSIRAFVNTDNTTATIVSWQIE